MTKSLRLRAFAKINIGLKVLGRRTDGYHELRTIYQTVALHDRLEISLSRGTAATELSCDDVAIPLGPENLVYRACQAWRRATKYRGTIRIRLEKRIPAGSGLGGGSSDAAAALLGLERLSGNRMAATTRIRLAARLGSDVPLFLYGGRVLGCGRGEEVYPLTDLPNRTCLIIFPGFSVSTGAAYRALDRRQATGPRLTQSGPAFNMITFGARSSFPREVWGPAENDFERVVFAQWPELAGLKRRLIRAGAEIAALTGSGSAVYAVFPSARIPAQLLDVSPASWQAFHTRTLSRPEYQQKLFQETG